MKHQLDPPVPSRASAHRRRDRRRGTGLDAPSRAVRRAVRRAVPPRASDAPPSALAITRDGATWFSPAVTGHPLEATVRAHEWIHRTQFFASDRPEGSVAALERDAKRGAEALLAGRPYPPTVAAPAGVTLAFDVGQLTDAQIDEQIAGHVQWLEDNPSSSPEGAERLRQLDRLQAELHQPTGGLPGAQLDAIVRETILAQLEGFQNIEVTVRGDVPVPQLATAPDGITEARRIVEQVRVDAAYFINTATANATFQHQAADFQRIVGRVNASLPNQSLIVSGVPYTRGRAVQVGKATPADIQAFVQQAIDGGEVRAYAISEGLLADGQQLVDLGAGNLQLLLDQWIDARAVGVDCSGFVLQALIASRQAVRQHQDAAGFGRAVPAAVGRAERSAASFAGLPAVATPAELRPGDVWVSAGGGHIRVVTGRRLVRLTANHAVVPEHTLGPIPDAAARADAPALRFFGAAIEISALPPADLQGLVEETRAWISAANATDAVTGEVRRALEALEAMAAHREGIAFDTAESTGTSTRSTPGPVGRSWISQSLTVFHPIRQLSNPAVVRAGTLHRP